jgi:small conductance mechanosensitive channel
MESNTMQKINTDSLVGNSSGGLGIISEYGSLIVNGLYLIIGGMVTIYLLQKLATKLIYKHIKNKRLIMVFFGTLYVLVLVITALLALDRSGVNVEGISQMALVGVLIGAVLFFFLEPFIPRLPFKLGQMIDINGVLGTVDAISSFHTTIRKFDGTIVFIPNPLVIASKIMNYDDTPTLRIEIKLSVNNDSDLEETKALFLRLMGNDERVLSEPSPPFVYVAEATASGVDMMAFCWVKNKDWLITRSDLWLQLVDTFQSDDRIAMSLPQQEVFVFQDNEKSKK